MSSAPGPCVTPPAMRIDVVTIFPEYLAPLELSLIGKARRDGLLDVRAWDLRSFATGRHRTVDDTPYGGGAGMVMIPATWGDALDAVLAGARAGRSDAPPAPGAPPAPEPVTPRLIFPGPGGRPFTQALARELATERHLVFACGRYEGIDERVYDYATEAFEGRAEIISLGDYVLNGGEAAVLAMTEAIVRLLPGVVGNCQSLVEESHEDGLLEYPVYTKPASWRGREVPPVLLSGDHGAIAAWRHEQRLIRTAARRPDLLRPSSVPGSLGEGGITPATPGDAGELLTLRLACRAAAGELAAGSRADPAGSPGPAEHSPPGGGGAPGRAAGPGGTDEVTLAARAAGRLVGAVTVRPGKGGLTLRELLVAPDLRRRGIGRALLRAAGALTTAERPWIELAGPGWAPEGGALLRAAGYRPGRAPARADAGVAAVPGDPGARAADQPAVARWWQLRRRAAAGG